MGNAKISYCSFDEIAFWLKLLDVLSEGAMSGGMEIVSVKWLVNMCTEKEGAWP